jgi:hypothetical protein
MLPVGMSNGVVFNGGTPAHRHLEVSFGGQGIGVKVLVASEQDITSHLDAVSDSLGLPRELLDVIRPDEWPIPIMFPAWG